LLGDEVNHLPPLIATLPTRIVKRYAGLLGLAMAEVSLWI
jgi:hypothetical protein